MSPKYTPTLACIIKGHQVCEVDERCKFEKDPHRLWQSIHCKLCGFVRMTKDDPDESERWEPIDGIFNEEN